MEDSTCSEILKRLHEATGTKTDAALATALGLSHQAVYSAKTKSRIPPSWIYEAALRHSVSADWLFFGRGPMRPHAPSSQPLSPGLKLAHRLLASRAQPGAECTLQGSPLPDGAETDRPVVLVAKVKARLCAGDGRLEVSNESPAGHAFRADWLCRKGSPAQMALMDMVGDSMAPDIRDGDLVLIDQGKTDVIPGAIYAVGVDDAVCIRRLDVLPGRLVLSSANPAYAPIEVRRESREMASIRVIGRVLWWCHETR